MKSKVYKLLQDYKLQICPKYKTRLQPQVADVVKRLRAQEYHGLQLGR